MADILEVPLGTVKSRLHAAVGHFARRYRAVAKAARTPDDVLEGELWKEA
jgi:DNA-directed RNA polymerase specialized sigma24 family protein